MATGAEKRQMNKISGGPNAVFYLDGVERGGTISLVFEKEYAKAFAEGLLAAAEELPEEAPHIGMDLAAKLLPKNKVMVLENEIVQ